jgi:tripartite-type tricarboxylate transporter receptor subunit TctC
MIWKCMRPAIVATAILTVLNSAQAEATFPSRPITLIVPFSAGGPNDVMSRIVSEHMSRKLGQPIIVENVGGAGGTIGSTRVAKSTPDGYTLVSGHVGTHAAAPALYPNLRYDPLTDFVPIGQVAETPILVVTRRDLAADSMASFIAIAKQPGPGLTLGHAGVGSIGHISCLLFTSLAGFKPVEVPYRGSALAMTDLIAGFAIFDRFSARTRPAIAGYADGRGSGDSAIYRIELVCILLAERRAGCHSRTVHRCAARRA